MSSSVLLAASLERSASDLTSSATTAKPRPASPARAASTAALRASRFVWKAISLMSLMICEVPSAEALIFAIAPVICTMAAAAFGGSPLRLLGERVGLLRVVGRLLRHARHRLEADEPVSSSELACSEAPAATASLDEAILARRRGDLADRLRHLRQRTVQRLAGRVERVLDPGVVALVVALDPRREVALRQLVEHLGRLVDGAQHRVERAVHAGDDLARSRPGAREASARVVSLPSTAALDSATRVGDEGVHRVDTAGSGSA